jgi:chromosome segregation ATPase
LLSLIFNKEATMTRIKEPDPNLDDSQIPDYKSPPHRIIKSLRQAYDNLRRKIKEKSDTIQDLREKLRDTQQSRDTWKERMKVTETEVEELKKENEKLENEVKKNVRNYG